tara:strand:- start:486 stop:896 length:411 start_codon:yes stop_codon:yes gene_type:complete
MSSTLSITTTFAALFTIFYLFLSMRIGYLRGSPVMKLIFKMDKKVTENKLERNVRAHGNFSEYVPLFLIMLFLAEYLKIIQFKYLIMLCIIFLYGRIAHAVCFAFFDYNPFLRISGMICTYLVLGILSILLLVTTF